jgi:hydroxyacylglutathione hydrolase
MIGFMAERIPIPELKKKLESKNKPIVVDVRDASEIRESGAIPGAIHIPMKDIEKRKDELPKDADIVFY